MTQVQKIIKYLAIAFAIFLIVGIASGVVGILSSIFDGPVPEPDHYEYVKGAKFDGEIHSIDIDIAAAELTVKTGDVFFVESASKYIEYKVENGVLKVEESDHSWHFHRADAGSVVVTVPADTLFRNAEISTGAGKVDIEYLNAETVDLEFGAGSVTVESITASSRASIECGAGKLVVMGGALTDLEFDLGIGEVEIRAALNGYGKVNCGIGRAEFILLGSEADYSVRCTKGIGSATLNGKEMSDGTYYGDGSSKVDIEGGIGSIVLRFSEN